MIHTITEWNFIKPKKLFGAGFIPQIKFFFPTSPWDALQPSRAQHTQLGTPFVKWIFRCVQSRSQTVNMTHMRARNVKNRRLFKLTTHSDVYHVQRLWWLSPPSITLFQNYTTPISPLLVILKNYVPRKSENLPCTDIYNNNTSVAHLREAATPEGYAYYTACILRARGAHHPRALLARLATTAAALFSWRPRALTTP